MVIAILNGNGGGLTIGALIGLAIWVYAQIVGFRQTTKPKAVEKIGGRPDEVSSGRKWLADILTGKQRRAAPAARSPTPIRAGRS